MKIRCKRKINRTSKSVTHRKKGSIQSIRRCTYTINCADGFVGPDDFFPAFMSSSVDLYSVPSLWISYNIEILLNQMNIIRFRKNSFSICDGVHFFYMRIYVIHIIPISWVNFHFGIYSCIETSTAQTSRRRLLPLMGFLN